MWQVMFPAVVQKHYVTYVLNLVDKRYYFLTSMAGFTFQNQSRRFSEFEQLGIRLMKEASSFIIRMNKAKRLSSPYDFSTFGWTTPMVPTQPDGSSCGVFTMIFCDEWKGEAVQMKSFAGWNMPRLASKKKENEQLNIVNKLRMKLCLDIVLHDSNPQETTDS